ncbi:MAG: hypothetical protein A3J30_00095 [Candidatus Wildermuthbacteria bacterium RIFCSPLOWO2_02_FULL_47_9c]|uniref:Uncharacterized protein n=2 Tax=Patescibacteria group TaxID=1783273 RepID=A0A0G0WFZ2_9BACT|nr:MAG: hypothetical protein UU67_C0090G0002 [Candidatus Daviesbacteria bacterium GW2011_GWB1_41_5]OHA76420.1 MAG: hypothetical protein A3J30_00095 [Candidatus Wildermuthbacteria bacterium RIFCSPLOWO2_02_FULL_47_9c]
MRFSGKENWWVDAEKYTEEQWVEEMKAPGVLITPTFGYGRTLPCPNCKTVGFYGPRADDLVKTTRKYRACKYCGFWQEAFGPIWEETQGEAYRCTAVHCTKCGIYDWRVPWADRFGDCETCKIPLQETQWAFDEPDHPFRKIKSQIILTLNL